MGQSIYFAHIESDVREMFTDSLIALPRGIRLSRAGEEPFQLSDLTIN
jgi:hypothetical protein